MGFSSGFAKFIKKNFIHPEEEKTNNSTPAGSIYSAEYYPAYTYVSNGFIRDPTRCGNVPDVVGHYYDPMGGKFSLLHGVDPTNTGA
ncbi:hypothetical protein G6F56_005056 [Rhizopus delemar]|nr:hypothetical protein G6F56_005056 [Rhizopus delemar]